MTKDRFKKTNLEHGASHDLLITGVILLFLVGVLGFVGYNTWQSQGGGREAEASTRAKAKILKLKVATYNILGQRFSSNPCSSKYYGEGKFSLWEEVRRGRVVKVIRDTDPDIIGLQEVNGAQHKEIPKRKKSESCPLGSSYKKISQYSDLKTDLNDSFKKGDKKYKGYATRSASTETPIFWKRAKFKSVGSGSKEMLQETKEGAEAKYATWVKLESIKGPTKGKRIYVVNIHTRHGDDHATYIDNLKTMIDETNTEKLPMILTGDFNSSKLIEDTTLTGYFGLADARSEAKNQTGEAYSAFNSGDNKKGLNNGKIIDHIMFSKVPKPDVENVKPKKSKNLKYTYNIESTSWRNGIAAPSPFSLKELPSDHGIISSTLKIHWR